MMIPTSGTRPDFAIFVPFLILMMLGHFFTMFCLIYILYFTAKTFRSAELQREAHFSDYIGEFFLLWFHFIGVWVIQPRINAIVDGRRPAADYGNSHAAPDQPDPSEAADRN